jgi:uncharacterized protein YecA (UPF0149 family)
MGAIAESIVAYAQPLIDQTDGSMEQMQKAMTIGQLCWNLALLSPEEREDSLRDVLCSLDVDEKDFEDLQRDVIEPMIRRHEEMFPQMHGRAPSRLAAKKLAAASRSTPQRAEGPRVGRNSPCPCGSGRKFKQCCGG